MHPNHRLSLSLVVSLALWAPTFRATFDGEVDILTSTVRWVVAFAVASVCIAVVTNLLHAYRPAEVDEREAADTPATAGD